MTQSIYFFVDGGFFLDVSTCLHDIRLWLIIVIIRHEIMHCIFWEKFLEFLGKLSSESFIVRENQCWTLELRDDIRHRKSLSRSGHTEKCLEIISLLDRINELPYGVALVTSRGIWGIEFEHSVSISAFLLLATQALSLLILLVYSGNSYLLQCAISYFRSIIVIHMVEMKL